MTALHSHQLKYSIFIEYVGVGRTNTGNALPSLFGENAAFSKYPGSLRIFLVSIYVLVRVSTPEQTL